MGSGYKLTILSHLLRRPAIGETNIELIILIIPVDGFCVLTDTQDVADADK